MIELTWPEINLKPFIDIGIMFGNYGCVPEAFNCGKTIL